MQTHAAQYEFTGRREDRRLVTGRGKYTDDWNLPGQLHAVFVRADRAHAILRAVKTDAAMRHPGVVAVVTSRDIANEGWKNPGTMVSYPGRGKPLQIPHHSMLATERVRYVGEEIAMVVAQTAAIARDAAELVEVDYQDLPAAVDVEAAMKPGAAQLYPDIVNNVCFDYDYGNEAATAEAFKAAHHITRLRAESQRISGNPMELRGAIAAHDQASDSFDLYLPHQGMTMMRGGLIGIMGLTPDKLRIRAIDVGGGFGPRSGVYAEFPVLLWAAKKLGRPIKWQSTRNEIFMTEFPGRALVLNGELALDRNGKFLAIRMQWTCDQGAYLSGAGPFINTLNAAMTITGCYTIPVAYGRHQLVLTNTVPTTAYRGAGRPDMAYIVERLVDQAATETGIDRIELRRRNAVPKAAFPYKTPCNNVEYDSGDYATLLNEAMSKCDWAGFPARRAASAAKGKLRGIGMGLFVEPAEIGKAHV